MSKYKYTTDMAVDTLPEGRVYHTPAGSFPSITTVLGKTSPNQVWLTKWKESVGEEEAARISKIATDRGTLVHSYAEDYFNNKLIDYSHEPADVRHMVRSLIETVSPGLTEIWGQEQILWSTKLRYAGRTDMVGMWHGIPSIIDFKTSKKQKTESAITDYFIQCCAYAVAHNEMFGTGIKQGIIAITIETGKPQLFVKQLPTYLYALKARRLSYDKLV